MICNIKGIILFTIILSVCYWTTFLGHELVSLISMRLFRQYDMIGTQNITNSAPAPKTSSIHEDDGPGQIPKILHRMWKNGDLDRLPPRWKKGHLKCRALHPDWQVILWTDDTMRTFIAERYPLFLDRYDRYRYHIQRVDAARYFILHHYGGVYMDLDIRCLRSLDPLRRAASGRGRGVLIPKTGPVGFSNDMMFASRGHPFFGSLIASLPEKNRWYGSPYPTVMLSTGSAFVSLVYDGLSEAEQDQVLVLSPELYGTDRDHRFVRHLPGGTWHGLDAAAIRWLRKFFTLIPESIGYRVAIIALLVILAACAKPNSRRIKIP